MTATTLNRQINTASSTGTLFGSEIFPLVLSNNRLNCFRLVPELEREEANRLSYHLSKRLLAIVVIWHQGYFYALGSPKIDMGAALLRRRFVWVVFGL